MDVLSLTKKLIEKRSISPNDAGCQELLAELLQQANFNIEEQNFNQIKNLWATHGAGQPLFVFAGHTDVVPPGPQHRWESAPFIPTEKEGYLVGRGAADMKAAVAAMTMAAIEFVKNHPNHPGTVALLITSCEEVTTDDGTKKVVQTLQNRGMQIDYCVVGEAASNDTLCDQIKVGRRGSFSGELVIKGQQGHVAYPLLADNAIHKSLRFLQALTEIKWDEGDQFFPPTSLQISNIHAGTGANNVVPGELSISFNLRYSQAVTAQQLQSKIEHLLKTHHLEYQAKWEHSAEPFLTKRGKLIQAVENVIQQQFNRKPALATSGGTSDARFIAPTGAQVVEVGFSSDTIHQVNEKVRLEDIVKLQTVYCHIVENLLHLECSV